MQRQGVLDHVEAVAVNGFPLDWNHWQVHEWLREIEEVIEDKALWVSEVGVSTCGN